MAIASPPESGGRISRLWGAFDGLAGDTVWSAALDFMAIVSAMVSFLLLQQVLTVNAYGSFAALYALATTFSAITYSGPGLALIQRRFRYKQELDDIQASFLSLTLLAGLISSVLAVVMALLLIKLSLIEIVLVTASELFANSTIFVCSWLVQAARGFPAMIKIRMIAVALKLVAVPVLFLTDLLTIRNLGATYLVLYGLFAFWLVLRYLPRIGYNISFRKPPTDVIKSSSVFAVPLAANQVQSNGDKVTLEAFNLSVDAGLYAAAYRVVLLGALPLRVIGQAAFHRFLPEDENNMPGYHLRRSAQLTLFMFAIGVAVAGAMYFFVFVATPVLDLLITEKFSGAKEIIPWLVLFIPLLAISGTPTNGLLGLGRTKERALLYLSSATFSVVLYLILIPGRGWTGAVAATLISETYLAIVSWWAMIHYQRIADRENHERTPVEA